MALQAGGARTVFCQLRTEAEKPATAVPEFQRLKVVNDKKNIAVQLQPRVCTLRSFGGDRGGVIKLASNSSENSDQAGAVTPFFEILSDYIESSKKSHDFEIITGRLAMIVFAATVSMEVVTGNSVFRKMDLAGIEEAGGACLAAVTSAAIFAWFSSNRNRVGRIFTTSCNTFIDSLIDKVIDGLFYDIDISDWSDEI